MSQIIGQQITTLLIANRGEVVSRIARTAIALGIRVVGVYADSDANSLYLDDVDAAFALGDDTTGSPYLDHQAIIKAATAAGADAVHPGYGFLAENAEFAEACTRNGLIWVGPPPAAMREMAGKIRAKEIARAAGVPVLESVEIGDELAPVYRLINDVGLPLLVKPSAGGGGKGMHRVDSLDGLEDVVAGARREAVASFGDGTLFAERYVERPRHVEVQIFADQHGNVIHLGDRDCSVQRRHQKIIEEAPAPGLPEAVRGQLHESAVALARQIGYVGAGTVEYLYFDGRIAFLEMNTRLQVEHPVTEEITGLDLVELQLRVAAGEPLPVRQDDVQIDGHAIEVRLYAEDPAKEYLPSPGLVRRLDVPDSPAARWELGVGSGSMVSSRYDPMIAKVITKSATRMEAARKLVSVLSRMRLHGVATNRWLLGAIIADPVFLSGGVNTAFLDERPDLVVYREQGEQALFRAVAVAVHAAIKAMESRPVQRFSAYGWRNLRIQDEMVHLETVDEIFELWLRQERDGSWRITVEGIERVVRVFGVGPGHIDIEVFGQRERVSIAAYADGVVADSASGQTHYLTGAALSDLTDRVRPGSYVAPIPGSVVAVSVRVGEHVVEGQTLVIVEAMKMEHRLKASGAGVVRRILVRSGDSVDYQQVLVELEADPGGP